MARPKKEKEVKQESLETQLWKSADKLRKYLARTQGNIVINQAVAGIQKLRSLHTRMDNAVFEAYGWAGHDLRHDFYEVEYLPEPDRTRFTLHPAARREVLKHPLALNHKIHEEEVAAGLWEKKGKTGKTLKQQEGQMGLGF
ncbi:MAG: hypothetical protein HGB06_02530 [Chlorobaculum sp.]|nr:hypothetical protein [Chlorobaculum sp.]